jgi:hypothetical protein
MTRAPDAVALDALCEAKTRSVRPLGGPVVLAFELQETRLKLAIASRTVKRADFFKRQAPNYRKIIDLGAK